MIKFLWKEGTDADEIQRRLQTVYDDSNSARSPISDCVRNFQSSRTEIHDFHRSGRRPIDHIDDHIMFLLRTFPFHRVRAFAETLRASPSTIPHHLRDSRFKTLSFSLGAAGTEMSLERENSRDVSRIAAITENGRKFVFAHIVTGDESWLYLNYSHTHI
jgi:hypothetical protein